MTAPFRPNTRPLVTLLAGLALGAAGVAAPASAGLQGISYALSPTYDVVRWDGKLGMENTELYGGRLGIDFGRMIAVQGYYLIRPNVTTRLGDTGLRDMSMNPLADRELDVSNYGADLILNLGTAGVVPYLKAGGGVLQFRPDRGGDVRQIGIKAGGGVRFGIDRLQADLYAEDLAFRLDRYDLAPPAGGPYPVDPRTNDIRHNLTVGAGLTFFLGGYRGDRLNDADRAVLDRYRHGLSGLSIPVEPFFGRLGYNDKLDLESQDVLGIRTGFDFGRYFGIRGYYWRGVNDQLQKFRPVQSWGGEAQFNLNSGEGIVPYLVAGVGELDFRKEYRDRNGNPRNDKTALIAGGGLGFNLSDRFRVDVAGRDYVFSENRLQDTVGPDELFSNWMLSASVGFSLGGSSPSGQRPLIGGGASEIPSAAEPVSEAEPEKLAEPGVPGPATPGEAAVAETTETVTVDENGRITRTGPAGERGPGRKMVIEKKEIEPAGGYAGERTITVPVPTEGEIYIRYGTPGGVSIESRNASGGEAGAAAGSATGATGGRAEAAPVDREAIRQAVHEELQKAGLLNPEGAGAAGLTGGDLDKLARELDERIDRRVDEQVKAAMAGTSGEKGETSVAGSSAAEPSGGGGTAAEPGAEPYRRRFHGFRPYTGWNVDDPGQIVFGGRVNMGPVTRNSRILFMPELALGFGSDVTSYLLDAGLHFDIAHLGGRTDWTPFLETSVGILHYASHGNGNTDLVLNLGYGVSANFGAVTAFAEHQGVDLFDHNRILVGLRVLE